MNVMLNKPIGNQAGTATAAKKRNNAFRNMNGDLLQAMDAFANSTNDGGRRRRGNGSDSVSAAAASSSTGDSNIFVALTSGRGHAQTEIGLAAVDIDRPTLKVSQISDDIWYTGLLTKLNILQPVKIIVPHTVFDARPDTPDAKLLKSIREQFPTFVIMKIPRRHFNNEEGVESLKKYGSEKYEHVKQTIETKYYALSAVSGLLKYLQYYYDVNFIDHSLKMEFETKYAHMLIDVKTTHRLELLAASTESARGRKSCLFDLLNSCSTAIGKRTLRARILEPSCDEPDILSIHDCINELIRHPNKTFVISEIQEILNQFYAVDRLSKLTLVVPQESNIRAAEILINRTLQLRNCLQNIPQLRHAIKEFQSKIFREISDGLDDRRYEHMLEQINHHVNENVTLLGDQVFQRVNCVKSDINPLLDLSRTLFHELTGQMRNEAEEMSTKYGVPIKLVHNATRGFHMQLMIPPGTDVDDFAEDLIVLQMKRNNCLLATANLNKLNIRMKGVVEEVTMQTNIVLTALIVTLVKELDVIYDLSGFVATLDIVISLAKVSMTIGYVCPTFSNEMRIVEGLHPLLESNIEQNLAVPNNVIATPDFNFYIITGPNMGGKTVYIKMVATLQIMAQLGCFVPAASAQFRITDRIFTRMGFNDSIEQGASTFALEISEMEYILCNITPNSILIIDEICRSTKPSDGKFLAWKICEQLICLRGIANNGDYFTDGNQAERADRSTLTRSSTTRTPTIKDVTAPFIFVTTHYFNLTRFPEYYFNAVNLNVSAEEVFQGVDRHLKYDYVISEGVTGLTSYGLALAKTVRFPDAVVPRAEEIFKIVSDTAEEEYDEVNASRRPSPLSAAISLKLTKQQKGNIDDSTSSVLSIHSKSKKHPMQTLNVGQPEGIDATQRTRTTSVMTIDEDQQRIDRVFYNLYSDLASVVRCAKTTATNEDGELISDDPVPAIIGGLEHFMGQHRGDLIDATMEYVEANRMESVSSQTIISNLNAILRVQNPTRVDESPVPEPTNGQPIHVSLPETETLAPEIERPSANFITENGQHNNASELSNHSLQRQFVDQNDVEMVTEMNPLLFQHELNDPEGGNPFMGAGMAPPFGDGYIPSAYDVVEENEVINHDYRAQPNDNSQRPFIEDAFSPIPIDMNLNDIENQSVFNFGEDQQDSERNLDAGAQMNEFDDLNQGFPLSQNVSEFRFTQVAPQAFADKQSHFKTPDGRLSDTFHFSQLQSQAVRNNTLMPTTPYRDQFDVGGFSNFSSPPPRTPVKIIGNTTGRLSLEPSFRQNHRPEIIGRMGSAFEFDVSQQQPPVGNVNFDFGVTSRNPTSQDIILSDATNDRLSQLSFGQEHIFQQPSPHSLRSSSSGRSLGIKRPKLSYQKSKLAGNHIINFSLGPPARQANKAKATDTNNKHESEPVMRRWDSLDSGLSWRTNQANQSSNVRQQIGASIIRNLAGTSRSSTDLRALQQPPNAVPRQNPPRQIIDLTKQISCSGKNGTNAIPTPETPRETIDLTKNIPCGSKAHLSAIPTSKTPRETVDLTSKILNATPPPATSISRTVEPKIMQTNQSPSLFGDDSQGDADTESISHISATPPSVRTLSYPSFLPPPLRTPLPGAVSPDLMAMIIPAPDIFNH